MSKDYPILDWRGDIPVATRFDDPYYSLVGGLAETRHVFLAGNGLPERFSPGFHVAELGFGTGLNQFATIKAWQDTGNTGQLQFTSFEKYLMGASDMARALSAFPELAPIVEPILQRLSQGDRIIETDWLRLVLIIGDARETLPLWDSKADAWYLDGFSPAKNPELWEPPLLAEVARHTRPRGTAATYSAAGHVRTALTEAGFTVTRQPGFGRKRHMTKAILP